MSWLKTGKLQPCGDTLEWELAPQKIETNEMNPIAFQKEMEAYAKSTAEELLQTSIAMDNPP